VLDEDYRMVCLLQNGHELKESKCSTDLQVLEPSVKLAEDAGVVPTDVEHFVTLQVQVSVQSLDEQLSGTPRMLKDLDLRETVESSSKSMIRYRVPKRY